MSCRALQAQVTTSPYGFIRKVQLVAPAWGTKGFDPFVLGEITSHHIAAGILGLHMGNVEIVLFSAAIFFATFVVAGTL
ncbi:unnamed protein product [Sphagnum tenellum]